MRKFPRILFLFASLCGLIFLAACGGGSSNSSTRQPVLPPTGANYTTCNNQQVPNWESSTFQSNYKNAIYALVAHYGSDSRIGYIRIGLGRGGEINLPQGWNDSSSGACYGGYTSSWGYTVGSDATSNWNAYLQGMVQYEGGLNSPHNLLVSITPVNGSGVQVDDFIAPVAVHNGLSFGNQGLESSDLTASVCGGDWCNLFGLYPASPSSPIRELQTLGQSCPTDVTACVNTQSTSTGSLAPLLPFAVDHGVNDLELYYQDWLIAYDPTYAQSVGASTSDSASYVSAIVAAAAGGAQMQVLFPPTSTSDPDFSSVQQFVMNQGVVSGVVIDVDWSDFDIGNATSGTHTNFDWTISDAAVALYAASGIKVNLVLQDTTYGGSGCPSSGIGSNGSVGSNCAMPAWMWTALSQ